MHQRFWLPLSPGAFLWANRPMGPVHSPPPDVNSPGHVGEFTTPALSLTRTVSKWLNELNVLPPSSYTVYPG